MCVFKTESDCPTKVPTCCFHGIVGRKENNPKAPSMVNRVTLARGCDLHTSPHSGWYFFNGANKGEPPPTAPAPPLYPQHTGPSNERGRPRHVSLYLIVCIFGCTQIQHASCADKFAIVGLCSGGPIEEISSEDGG